MSNSASWRLILSASFSIIVTWSRLSNSDDRCKHSWRAVSTSDSQVCCISCSRLQCKQITSGLVQSKYASQMNRYKFTHKRTSYRIHIWYGKTRMAGLWSDEGHMVIDSGRTLEAVQWRACQIINSGGTYRENCALLQLENLGDRRDWQSRKLFKQWVSVWAEV